VVWALAFALPLVVPSHSLLVNEIAIVALFAMSLDLILGYGGIVSLGHAAFFGFGAYTAALFAKHRDAGPDVGLLVAPWPLGAARPGGQRDDPARQRPHAADGHAGHRAALLELANKLDWLTGGADGMQGVVLGPVLGLFEFDLYGRTAAWYSLSVLLLLFLVMRRARAFALRRDAEGDPRQPAARDGHRHPVHVALSP
jgi:branched-chain amino acid transport system permease protein